MFAKWRQVLQHVRAVLSRNVCGELIGIEVGLAKRAHNEFWKFEGVLGPCEIVGAMADAKSGGQVLLCDLLGGKRVFANRTHIAADRLMPV